MRLASTRPARASCDIGEQQIFGLFESLDGLLTSYGRELVSKLVERIAAFEAVDQSFEGHPRSTEAGGSVHDFRVRNNDSALHDTSIAASSGWTKPNVRGNEAVCFSVTRQKIS
jgi:hypothetical protein